jgi:chemotaxis regulatin CheY-phosphate phosphatase CheZ
MRVVDECAGGERPAPADDKTALRALQERQGAWEIFAADAMRVFETSKAQMTAVTQETERAALELAEHLRILTSPNQTITATDRSASLSRIVVAMQFQDITRQKLEHVGQSLDRLSRHLEALLKDPQSEEARKEMAALQQIAQCSAMGDERRSFRETLRPDYVEPVPIERLREETDSATLF